MPVETRATAEPETGAGPGVPGPDVRGPSLRTRDSRLAALIDACYPSASRRLGEEGRVVIRVRVDAGGRPAAWNIVERSGFARLDAAADCVVRTAGVQSGAARWRGRGGERIVADRVPAGLIGSGAAGVCYAPVAAAKPAVAGACSQYGQPLR